ncbi:MAG: hypothetical protein MHM6MM_000287 [Cercozoa sp. M6MM]
MCNYNYDNPGRWKRLFRTCPVTCASVVFLIAMSLTAVVAFLQSSARRRSAFLEAQRTVQQGQDFYMIAANFYNNAESLPRTLEEIEKLLRILNSNKLENQRVLLSVYESASLDGTPGIVRSWRRHLRSLGVPAVIRADSDAENYAERWRRHNLPQQYWEQDDIRAPNKARIDFMAELRNEAMAPFLAEQGIYTVDRETGQFASDMRKAHEWFQRAKDLSNVKVVFLNDIVFDAADIVSLVGTNNGKYDAACAMDFFGAFYDTWVTRDLNGDVLSGYHPYVAETNAQAKAKKYEPFQVYSCWNGAVVFRAESLRGLKFRSWKHGELRSPALEPSVTQVTPVAVPLITVSVTDDGRGSVQLQGSCQCNCLVSFCQEKIEIGGRAEYDTSERPPLFCDPAFLDDPRLSHADKAELTRKAVALREKQNMDCCAASECQLIFKDMWLKQQASERRIPKVYINPVVQVTYDSDSFATRRMLWPFLDSLLSVLAPALIPSDRTKTSTGSPLQTLLCDQARESDPNVISRLVWFGVCAAILLVSGVAQLLLKRRDIARILRSLMMRRRDSSAVYSPVSV